MEDGGGEGNGAVVGSLGLSVSESDESVYSGGFGFKVPVAD